MREFDLVIPKNLPDALDALASGDTLVQPLAGGTDTVVDIRARRTSPRVLVALSDVAELRGIRRDDGVLSVGACTSIANFLTHPLLLEYADGARQAAHVFANPMIRNLATVGGNLGSASPAGDLIPPLLALDVQLELVSKHGTRKMPLEEFFLSPRKTARRADELIYALLWKVKPKNRGEAYYKLGLRQADAISVISVAVVLERDGDRVRDARIALGAVAPRPLRAQRAEQILNGQPFTDAIASEAARAAALTDCAPIDDLRASAAYRRRMVSVYVRRVLHQAWNQAH